jgi:anthranilate phosphoribosyltransferase
MDFSAIISKLLQKHDLTRDESSQAISSVMSGEWSPPQVASLLTALHCKGETIDEIVGAAAAMRSHAVSIESTQKRIVDTCGTGGDKSGTFNISTTTAFVVAGAGVPVAKHGNRSASSKCGSIDLFEQIGVNVMASPETVTRCLNETGLGVLFARTFHPAMKHAAPIRSELKFRTIFNFLGPLTNPARPSFQLVGISDQTRMETYANCLQKLGIERAWVVNGCDGLDELTLTGPTKYYEVTQTTIETGELQPEDVGLQTCSLNDLLGGTPEENAEITKDIIEGRETGPKRDAVLLNSGVALYISGKTNSIQDGIELAKTSIESGKAREKMEQLVSLSNQ